MHVCMVCMYVCRFMTNEWIDRRWDIFDRRTNRIMPNLLLNHSFMPVATCPWVKSRPLCWRCKGERTGTSLFFFPASTFRFNSFFSFSFFLFFFSLSKSSSHSSLRARYAYNIIPYSRTAASFDSLLQLVEHERSASLWPWFNFQAQLVCKIISIDEFERWY